VSAEIVLLRSMDEIERAAKAMTASGYFQDARQAAQAVVKILAGREMGFGPFASMTGIHIIQGRPTLSANLMAAAVKRHPLYDYRVLEMSGDVCRIEFLERGKRIGVSVFTIDDARRAGTKNMNKYPRNMLFARAMSNGVRWYCPDVFAGSAVYTPGELGADDDTHVSGVVGADVVEYKAPAPKNSQSGAQKPTGALRRPLSPEDLRKALARKIEALGDYQYNDHDGDRGVLVSALDSLVHGEANRHALTQWLIGCASTQSMSDAQVRALMDWVGLDEAGQPHPAVPAEAGAAMLAALNEQVQQSLPGVNDGEGEID